MLRPIRYGVKIAKLASRTADKRPASDCDNLAQRDARPGHCSIKGSFIKLADHDGTSERPRG